MCWRLDDITPARYGGLAGVLGRDRAHTPLEGPIFQLLVLTLFAYVVLTQVVKTRLHHRRWIMSAHLVGLWPRSP